MEEQPTAPGGALTVKQQILATPPDGVYPQSGDPCSQPAGDVLAQLWRTHDGAENALSRQVGDQSLTAYFNFREFWHCCYREKSITCATRIMTQTASSVLDTIAVSYTHLSGGFV